MKIRRPVTLRALDDACRCVGVPLDSVLDDPQSALKDVRVPLDRAREFVRVVATDDVDLDDLSVSAAHNALLEALSEFFTAVVSTVSRANARMVPVWERSGVPASSRGAVPLMRALGSWPFADFQRMMDAPLDDVLVYFHLRAINAAHAENKKR